ncbi:hypothetical protein [Shewanella japonica]|uniref:hypothetical protein n=1 Tax=Shewanella japonica TaxID=93973 RepID=UPI000E76CAFD|nr:hypothetical protein [Shewanella japonica]
MSSIKPSQCRIIFVLLLAFVAWPSHASLKLRDMYFNPKSNIQLENITNISETESDFVKVSVSELHFNKETAKFDEIALSDPTDLVISPSRIVIPPLSTVPFRVISKPSDKLKIYRVRFTPISPKIELGFTQEEIDSAVVATGVTIKMAMGTIFYIDPIKKQYDTNVERKGKEVVVTNNGNSMVIIDQLKSCKGEVCKSEGRFLLRPGSVYKFAGEVVKLRINEGEKSKKWEL